MLNTAIILFAIAAVFGLSLLIPILKGKPTNKAAVFAHGILAAIALVILITFALDVPEKSPIVSIVIFVIAALGGFILFYRDMMGKPGPKGLAIVHALAAVTGFILLLVFAFA